jgi:hypothetical protein
MKWLYLLHREKKDSERVGKVDILLSVEVKGGGGESEGS